MKQTAIKFFSPAFVLLLTGCTQPDGDIGDLFGSWSLQEMTCDGSPLSLPEDSEGSTVSFQSNIAMFNIYYDNDETGSSVCTWIRTDDTMTFNFNNSDNKYPAGTGIYAPPAWLRFSEPTETIYISELNGRHFNFTRTASDGRIYTYKYNRTW